MLHTAASLISGGSSSNTGGGPLRDLLQAMRSVMKSMSQLGGDIAVASNSTKKWAIGESQDVEDTLSVSSILLNHYSSALIQFATHFDKVCRHLTDIASYEKALSDLKRSHLEATKKADSVQKKLQKMMSESKDVQAETLAWNTATEKVSQLSYQIRVEEVNIVEFRRRSARIFMEVLLGGLSECSRKGTVISTYGSRVIQHVTEEPPNASRPYSSYNQTREILTEAERSLHDGASTKAETTVTTPATPAPEDVQAQSPTPTRQTTTDTPTTHPYQSDTPSGYFGLPIIHESSTASFPPNPQPQIQYVPITPPLSEKPSVSTVGSTRSPSTHSPSPLSGVQRRSGSAYSGPSSPDATVSLYRSLPTNLDDSDRGSSSQATPYDVGELPHLVMTAKPPSGKVREFSNGGSDRETPRSSPGISRSSPIAPYSRGPIDSQSSSSSTTPFQPRSLPIIPPNPSPGMTTSNSTTVISERRLPDLPLFYPPPPPIQSGAREMMHTTSNTFSGLPPALSPTWGPSQERSEGQTGGTTAADLAKVFVNGATAVVGFFSSLGSCCKTSGDHGDGS